MENGCSSFLEFLKWSQESQFIIIKKEHICPVTKGHVEVMQELVYRSIAEMDSIFSSLWFSDLHELSLQHIIFRGAVLDCNICGNICGNICVMSGNIYLW